jgi:hypothetical protein
VAPTGRAFAKSYLVFCTPQTVGLHVDGDYIVDAKRHKNSQNSSCHASKLLPSHWRSTGMTPSSWNHDIRRLGSVTPTENDPHLGKAILPILALQGHRTEHGPFPAQHPFRLLTFIIRGLSWTLLGDGMGTSAPAGMTE